MGIMSPPYFDPGSFLRGEKRVFNLLSHTPDTFHILHSLQIRNHKKQLQGEADFVVLAPNYGIFVLEVKGGAWEVKDGQWIARRGNSARPALKKTPFVQAEDNKFSIRNQIVNKFPEMKNLLFSSGVVFPHISIPIELFELQGEHWRVWDEHNINDDIEKFIKLLSLKDFARHRKKNIHLKLPTEEQIEKIREYLRPNFECARLIRSEADYIDTKIESYTKDQFEVLDSMKENKRLVIKGGAGTGKTLIAAEAVRRQIHSFKKPLFLCKNAEITDAVQSTIQSEGYYQFYHNYPVIKTWDAFLRQETQLNSGFLDSIMSFQGQDYWANLPSLFNDQTDKFLKDFIEPSKDRMGDKSIMFYNLQCANTITFDDDDSLIKSNLIYGNSLIELKEKKFKNETLSEQEKADLDYSINHNGVTDIRNKIRSLLNNPFESYLINLRKKHMSQSPVDKEAFKNARQEQVREHNQSRFDKEVLNTHEWRKVHDKNVEDADSLFSSIEKEVSHLIKQKILLDSTIVHIDKNALEIVLISQSGHGFALMISKNLKDCHKKHINFLKDIKNNYLETFFKSSSNFSSPSLSDENVDTTSLTFDGKVYFLSDNNKRESWLFMPSKEQEEELKEEMKVVGHPTEHLKNIQRSSGEIYQSFKYISEINCNTSHDEDKRMNPYHHYFSKDQLDIRIQNEIDYYESKAQQSFFESKSMHDFYSSVLPKYKYDVIMIDESQDIVKLRDIDNDTGDPKSEKSHLYALHRMVKNGLQGGNWMFFLDPMQYTSGFKGISGGIASYNKVKKLMDKLHPAYRTLITNCRNTKEISETMFQLCDISEGISELGFDYTINKKIKSGIPPKFHYYDKVSEIPDIINKINKPLFSQGVKGSDIQILSMNNKFIPEVKKANKYFNIFTSDKGVYQNPNVGNEGKVFSRKDQIVTHLIGLENHESYYFQIRQDIGSEKPHYDEVKKNKITQKIAHVERVELNNAGTVRSKGVAGSSEFLIPEDGKQLVNDKYLYLKYLSKEQTLELYDKVKKLELNNYKIPTSELSKEKEKFLDSDIVNYLTINNPKSISFHEKFYKINKNGVRIIDKEQIELVLNFNAWYREFSTDSRLFIQPSSKINNNKLNPLIDKYNRTYNGIELKEKDAILDDEKKVNLVEKFENLCLENIDFENKSARHSSVHKFRGMDQKYVTLVGFNAITNYSMQALYIGMSRAKVKLDVIAQKSLAQKIERKLSQTND